MIIPGVWFCFAGDSACLVESVAAFRAAMPGQPVAIFDDGRAGVPLETIRAIEPDLYRVTDWPRSGNLNGWACVRGILEACATTTAILGGTGTLKVDCDTLVLTDRWIDPRKPLVGWDLGWIRYAAGMCRYLRADAPARLLAGLDRRPLITHPVGEDLAISAEASFEFPGGVLLHPREPSSPDGLRAAGWSYHRASKGQFGLTRPASCHAVVTFGNKAQLTCGRAQARSVVAAAMRRFREGLQGGCSGHAELRFGPA